MKHLILVVALMSLVACSDGEKPTPPADDGHGHGASTPSNRIAVPPSVRKNLDIRFAKASYRPVAATVRVPGAFEHHPDARRRYGAGLDGRLHLQVADLQDVGPGMVLFHISGPAWQQLRDQVIAAHAAVDDAKLARITAVARRATLRREITSHAQHADQTVAAVQLWQARNQQLQELAAFTGGDAKAETEARAALLNAMQEQHEAQEKQLGLQRDLQELELLIGDDGSTATLRRRIAQAGLRRQDSLAALASLSGYSVEALTRKDEEGKVAWQQWERLPVIATRHGTVSLAGLSDGQQVAAADLVLTTIKRDLVRFRAHALQADMARIAPDAQGVIVPVHRLQERDATPLLRGRLQLDVRADSRRRTVDVLVTPAEPAPWARAGVAAFLEYQVGLEAPDEVLAIPTKAIIQDGLDMVLFRRDPKDANSVIRLVADLGASDGQWIEVKSGLRVGDEVVTDGIYELKLTGSGKAPEGGHFHADGTWHAGEH